MNEIKEIFVRELERLNENSKQRPLSLNELRSLELLTKSLRTYKEHELEPEDDLKNASLEKLLALAKGHYETEPYQDQTTKTKHRGCEISTQNQG